MKEAAKCICAVCVLLVICASASAAMSTTTLKYGYTNNGWLMRVHDTDGGAEDGEWSEFATTQLTVEIPEPATLILLVVGGAGVLLVARRRHAHP